MLTPSAATPLNKVRYGSATKCRQEITGLAMVPFGSIPGCNYGYVMSCFAREGRQPPTHVPNPQQPGYWPEGYYESEFGQTPTEGMLCWLANEGLREREMAHQRAVEKLTEQQHTLQTQIQKLTQEYTELQSAYEAAIAEQKQDLELIQKLKSKLEWVLELLQDLGEIPKPVKKTCAKKVIKK
jgi:hypothetical protein